MMLSNVVSPGVENAAVYTRVVTGDSVKFASNRVPYKLLSLPSNYIGAVYIEGDCHKTTGEQSFDSNVPVTVNICMDSRYDHIARAPEGFIATGGTIRFTHGSDTLNFVVYTKDFHAGKVV